MVSTTKNWLDTTPPDQLASDSVSTVAHATSGCCVQPALTDITDITDALHDQKHETNNAYCLRADAFRPSESDLLANLEEFNLVSDLFAEAFIGLAGSCAGWPESPEPVPLIATGTAPGSLVIGGTSDAQTPIQWSEEMAQSIGGYFLASSHNGHTAVFNDESECVDGIVTSFLVDGQLPTAGDCLSNAD